jgi:hypothetical protein
MPSVPNSFIYSPRRAARQAFRHYLIGLLLPREHNKTVTVLASLVLGSDRQQLHHFLHDAPWDVQAMNARRLQLWQEHPTLRPHGRGVLIVDETGDRKRGRGIPFAAQQHIGKVGFTANGVVSSTISIPFSVGTQSSGGGQGSGGGEDTGPGKAVDADACQQGGYTGLIGINGTTDALFTNSGQCVSYAAHGGMLVPMSAAQPCLDGGYTALTSASGQVPFATEAACVLFVGQGGTPVAATPVSSSSLPTLLATSRRAP